MRYESSTQQWKCFFLFFVALAVIAPCGADAQLHRRYRLLVNQLGWKELQNPTDTTWYAPLDTEFEILQESDTSFTVRFLKVPSSTMALTFGAIGGIVAQPHTITLRLQGSDSIVANAPTPVRINLNYFVAKVQLLRINYQLESGPEYGTLTVPFKLQHASDGTLSAGASLGPFVGYRQRWIFGLPSSIVGSIGLAAVPVRDVNAPQSDVENKFGLTAAAGLVFEIFNGFQIGALVGVDHLGGDSGEDYKYEDKGWSSISIGYSFIR